GRRRIMSIRGRHPRESRRSRPERSGAVQRKRPVGRSSKPPSPPSCTSSSRSRRRTRAVLCRLSMRLILAPTLYAGLAVKRLALLLVLAVLALAWPAVGKPAGPPPARARAVLVGN